MLTNEGEEIADSVPSQSTPTAAAPPPSPEDLARALVDTLIALLVDDYSLKEDAVRALAVALAAQHAFGLKRAAAAVRATTHPHCNYKAMPEYANGFDAGKYYAAAAIERLIGEPAPSSPSTKLWLWRNFVDGRPEYWAFDNPYPVHKNGDPMTLGEPCGYAIQHESEKGRPSFDEAEVIAMIKRALAKGEPAP